MFWEKENQDMPIMDFEDALQIAAARKCSAEYIITRNIKHYKKSVIPAITPQLFLESYKK